MDWEEKLLAALLAGTIGSDDLTYVRIEHDDACRIFIGQGCSCQPTLKIARNSKMIVIGEDGKAVN